MNKIKNFIPKIIFILLIVVWMTFVITDYFRAKEATKPLICLSQKEETINNGTYYECTSWGYKYYEYIDQDGKKNYAFGAAFTKNPIKDKLGDQND